MNIANTELLLVAMLTIPHSLVRQILVYVFLQLDSVTLYALFPRSFTSSIFIENFSNCLCTNSVRRFSDGNVLNKPLVICVFASFRQTADSMASFISLVGFPSQIIFYTAWKHRQQTHGDWCRLSNSAIFVVIVIRT